MNRKEAAELSPFIKAFGEGRIIEFSSITDVSKGIPLNKCVDNFGNVTCAKVVGNKFDKKK